eukprot:15485671-Alexandrium_andersonii.AAC.1
MAASRAIPAMQRQAAKEQARSRLRRANRAREWQVFDAKDIREPTGLGGGAGTKSANKGPSRRHRRQLASNRGSLAVDHNGLLQRVHGNTRRWRRRASGALEAPVGSGGWRGGSPSVRPFAPEAPVGGSGGWAPQR